MPGTRGLTFAVAFAVLFGDFGLAQEWGTILGAVADPSGAAVPGASHYRDGSGYRGLSRAISTGAQGEYIVTSLRPGNYSLGVEAKRFFKSLFSPEIVLQANQSFTVGIKLELGYHNAGSVSVESAAVQVDTSTSTLRQVVDERRVVELPLNGRNAASLLTLVAGAIPAPTGGAPANGRFP